VCVYKRTTKRPKHNFSKHTQQAAAAAATTTIRQNTKNLHFEQLTPCSTASSNPITALSHTRRRKVERKDVSTSFLLVYFCGGRGAQILEGKIEARDSKTSREKIKIQKTNPKTRHQKSSRKNIQTNRRHWLGVEPERVFFFELSGVAA
jgi:hypothetical protein